MNSEILLRMAAYKRSLFFKLWNELQTSELFGLKVLEKLERIFEKFRELAIELPAAPKLPASVRFLSMLSSGYPEAFFELPQPPLGIFVEGDLANHRRGAVIGSRKPIPYSRRLTREIVKLWVERGLSIVSGGALGIDGEAHQACLSEGGHTIAVLGGGLRRLYPRTHLNLFASILKSGGALVSEYPPDFDAKPYTFPERNRLIAGFCDFLFLAQAHDQSGSLGTARAALDLGREIYVLRPVLGDANFAGSQALIDAGAKTLIDARELEQSF